MNTKTGRPNQFVQITVPPEDIVRQSQNVAVLTSADDNVGGGAVRMNSQTRLFNSSIVNEDLNSSTTTNGPQPVFDRNSNQQQQQQRTQAYNIRVPNHARPNQPFAVSVNGRTIQVQCPSNARYVFFLFH